MNFEFLKACNADTEELQKIYDAIITELENAETRYWSDPQKCGILLRGVAEKVCRIYNIYFEIGCPKNYSLEEFLCYTNDDAHNALVSRFLSGVRKEQRDQLNKLRVLGDDCIWGEDAPDQGMTLDDRMAQNAKRMMEIMMETLKEMCIRIHKRTDLANRTFLENDLPEKKVEQVEAVAVTDSKATGYKNIKEKIKKIFMVSDRETC